jgi:hypothetical protein
VHRAEGAELTIQQLIKEQRNRLTSTTPVERLAASLLISGVLAERLNDLSDPPVGQLLLDEVWSKLSLLGPESMGVLSRVGTDRQTSGKATACTPWSHAPAYNGAQRRE